MMTSSSSSSSSLLPRDPLFILILLLRISRVAILSKVLTPQLSPPPRRHRRARAHTRKHAPQERVREHPHAFVCSLIIAF